MSRACPTVPTNAGRTPTGGQTVVGTVAGNTDGLYGGTLNEGSCDREKQIAFLQANPDKAAAFARVLGITPDQIPDYLHGLTPVVLRHDTRVTNGAAGTALTARPVREANPTGATVATGATVPDEVGVAAITAVTARPTDGGASDC
ncbi:hypothetical protein LAUMK13_04715 [Mycobacterium innocens]|uniref:DUF6777 domain-containing protein n=1 Tax=Mycobacterium innocens TaxID=2341083 RepID=A0A498QH42_9MYCO|nr:hypothetical protein LAUMK13_04715 [Mycobacterium innocens]